MDNEVRKVFAIIITIIALSAVIAIGFSSLKFGKSLIMKLLIKLLLR